MKKTTQASPGLYPLFQQRKTVSHTSKRRVKTNASTRIILNFVNANAPMTKDKPIQEQDVVLVLPGCQFSPLVGSKGVVQRSMPTGLAVVQFQTEKRWHDPDDLSSPYAAKSWLIPWKYLKVLDSAYGNSVGELEELLEQAQDDLVTCRSCLEMSEQLREMQEVQLQYLIEETDRLKLEIYRLKGF